MTLERPFPGARTVGYDGHKAGAHWQLLAQVRAPM